jgi:hypothetical protein
MINSGLPKSIQYIVVSIIKHIQVYCPCCKIIYLDTYLSFNFSIKYLTIGNDFLLYLLLQIIINLFN